jgi:serine protease Do
MNDQKNSAAPFSRRACPPRVAVSSPRGGQARRLNGNCCIIGQAFLATVLTLVFLAAPSATADDTDAQQQAAIQAAVDQVAPAVVRIETVGGLERVGQVLFGSGPTTGLVVDPAGYVISSAFNFVNRPASILVRLPDGTRRPAKLVATDHSRMLVLLKVEPSGEPVRAFEIAPRQDLRVGQWVIAVGRTFETQRPNIAVGILSALGRVWGKAIQTDAAVSPNNYGGPLLDIRGRVLGVLVPLSPDATDEMAGVEWYDSGIGFAIPIEDVQKVLPRLKKGEDLYPGRAGVSFKGPNLYTGEPIIAACRNKSPAAEAGLKAGDKIVEIDGRKIARTADVKAEIGRRYAGEKLSVAALRGQQRIEGEMTLAKKLEPFQHGFLGILPTRSAKQGVSVRYVYPDSPAARAGIAVGETVVSLQGEPIDGRIELLLKLGMNEPGSEVELEVRRGDALRKVKVTLGRLPEDMPPKDLPPARANAKTAAADRPAVGPTRLKVPEFPNEVWAYVPSDYDAEVPYGLVVWLHPSGGFDWEDLLARWKPLCDRHDLILVAPKAADAARWTPSETAIVDRLLAQVSSTYNVDPARVVVHGYEAGGSLAFAAALKNRQMIRAVAAVEAAPAGQPPESDPLDRLAIYVATASKSPIAQRVASAVTAFQRAKVSVTVKPLGDVPRYLNADELAELVRWIDMLDRI